MENDKNNLNYTEIEDCGNPVSQKIKDDFDDIEYSDIEDTRLFDDDKNSKEKKGIKYFLGMTFISLIPFLIFAGQLFPSDFKSRPALLFFTSEILVITSVILFFVLVLIPICLIFVDKIDDKYSSNFGRKIKIKDIFVLCFAWIFIFSLIGKFYFDLNLYKKTKEQYYIEISKVLEDIKNKPNNTDEQKKIYRNISVISYKKFLSLPIPDRLMGKDFDGVFNKCKKDESSLLLDVCDGEKVTSSFSVERVVLLKHLFISWKPQLPFNFIKANNTFSKEMLIPDFVKNFGNALEDKDMEKANDIKKEIPFLKDSQLTKDSDEKSPIIIKK